MKYHTVYIVIEQSDMGEYSPFSKTCNSPNGLLSLWFANWARGCCKFY